MSQSVLTLLTWEMPLPRIVVLEEPCANAFRALREQPLSHLYVFIAQPVRRNEADKVQYKRRR